MSAGFEVEVDPHVAARQARRIKGSIAVAKLERLVSALQRDEGEAEIDIQFRLGDGGRIEFQLAVSAELIAQCQRCLGDVCYSVSSERLMAVLADESEIHRLPNEFEPVVIEDKLLNLIPVIEDELILSLPIVMKHDDCQPAVELAPDDDLDKERENPFAVLQQLKAKEPN